MKYTLLVILLAASAFSDAFAQQAAIPRLQIYLAVSEQKELVLNIKNSGTVPVDCLVAFPDPERMFCGFPDSAEFGFRDALAAELRASESKADWIPAILLNSIINQPFFSDAASASSLAGSRMRKLTVLRLDSGEVVKQTYNPVEILSLFRLQSWLKNAREFRVKFPLLMIVGETAFEKDVKSEWMSLP